MPRSRPSAGDWETVHFLVDVGADRTVFSAGVLRATGIQPAPAIQQLEGVGGRAESVVVDTGIRMTREDGTTIIVNGSFAAFPNPAALDMCVLGRDVTNLFAVIVDRPQDVVCLLAGNHRYTIVVT
jgi:hypothetical protein